MKPLIVALLFACLFSINKLTAQEGYEYSENMRVLYGTVFNGDTIPHLNIPEVEVTGYKFNSMQDEYWFNYYVKRVTKVYPYFMIAKTLVTELEDEKNNAKKKEYKNFKNERKEELMNEFEKELRDLKISEGKVLVKMINRETGTNFYDLIKEYNGGVKAWTYNIIANRYDYDLKEAYDPNSEENKMLELAIKHVLKSNQEN